MQGQTISERIINFALRSFMNTAIETVRCASYTMLTRVVRFLVHYPP